MRKPAFLHMRKQWCNPKFQASSYLLRLYSPVCVGLGQKPQRQVFSGRGSNANIHFLPINMQCKVSVLKG